MKWSSKHDGLDNMILTCKCAYRHHLHVFVYRGSRLHLLSCFDFRNPARVFDWNFFYQYNHEAYLLYKSASDCLVSLAVRVHASTCPNDCPVCARWKHLKAYRNILYKHISNMWTFLLNIPVSFKQPLLIEITNQKSNCPLLRCDIKMKIWSISNELLNTLRSK